MIDNSRVEYIDTTKGLGIFLVVLGHCYARENFITIWLNSFHMPLFFIVVGYILRYKQMAKGSLKFNIRSRLNNIVVHIYFLEYVYLYF